MPVLSAVKHINAFSFSPARAVTIHIKDFYITLYRYCGTLLTPTGMVDTTNDVPATLTPSPIITCDRPFRMFFQTGVLTPGNGNTAGDEIFSTGVHTQNVAPANVRGFEFTYRQLPGNC